MMTETIRRLEKNFLLLLLLLIDTLINKIGAGVFHCLFVSLLFFLSDRLRMIHRFSNLLLVLMITCSICLNNLKRTLPAVKRVQISSSKRPMKERVISTSITTTKKRIYTQIDLYEIQRILKLRPDDFYGILNLKTVKSEEHLMKAYRKYSLLVHPDRNAAPGADEAMQRVNAARDYFLNKLQEYYQGERQREDRSMNNSCW